MARGPTGSRQPRSGRTAGYLREEIETIEPRAVVPTGKHATKSVLFLEGMEIDGFLETVLQPIACPGLGTTVVPLVHPSYQNIWVPRLGYDDESYRGAIAERLAEIETFPGAGPEQ